MKALVVQATRDVKKKKKWVSWSGDAFYDLHKGQFTVPPQGIVVGSAVESDLSSWADYDGEIPKPDQEPSYFVRAVIYNARRWDDSKEVVDLTQL